MRSGFVWRACALWLAAVVLTVGLALPASAQSDPSGALIAPITPKPWQRPQTGATPPAAQSTPTVTAPPSSLHDLPLDAPPQALSPTPAPTAVATPTPIAPLALPGVLGLADARRMRILLIGTDSYKPEERGRSDTMVLLQADVQAGDMRMVSFLRDLYVAIPGHGQTRLNAAYVYGGAALLGQTLEASFGVTADRTVAVNFSVMVTLIDRVDGVLVEVSEKERKQLNSILKFYNTRNGFPKNDQLLEASGEQWLSGKQALCYSRIRKIDSDFQRVLRQRKVLMALYERVRGMEPLALAGVLSELYGQVTTDMTLADAVALVPVLLRLNAVTFESLTVPVKGGYRSITVQGSDVIAPDLEMNRQAIAAFLQ